MINKLINECKKCKPQINLKIQRVEANVWYDLNFAKHHYLTENLNKSCKCFLFTWNNVPCAFVGILNLPQKGHPNNMTISRIVILPEFQGLGLSSKILNFCGGIVKACGETFNLYIKTIHEKMGEGLERNKKWNPTGYNGKIRKDSNDKSGKYKNRLQRKSFCYRYDGEPLYGYEELMKPIKELRDIKKREIN